MVVEIPNVRTVKDTIPLERIRVQCTKSQTPNGWVEGSPQEMWGFVWMNRLPFCFRVWPSIVHTRLELLDENTEWGFTHVPKYPLHFKAPLFTDPINDDDRVYMLRGLRIKRNMIEAACASGKTADLFRHVMGKRGTAYQEFLEFYKQSSDLRSVYRNAVSSKCDENFKLRG